MTSQEFKLSLKNPKNVYCLISTDSEMIDLYMHRFKTAINAELVSYGQIKSYGKLFRKKTLNVLYLPKLDESIFNRKEFIFIYTDTIDKRSSIYKKYKDQIIELNNNYTSYIMKNSNMNEQDAINFAAMNNNDLGLIKNALIIYNESNSNYNRFTDYSSNLYLWINKYIKKEQLPRVEESPISIMALLSTNCQNILRVKQNNTNDMNPYVVKCAKELDTYITKEELIQIIGDCFYLDCMIKKGLIEPNYALDYIKVRRYSNNGFTN